MSNRASITDRRRRARVPAPRTVHHQLTLPAQASGLRLDQALAAALPEYSRARLQRWIVGGQVRVGGQAAKTRQRVHGGESVVVDASLEPEEALPAQPLPLDCVYEDADLLVLNKPPGLVVHPGAGNRDRTLQNALLAYDPSLSTLPRSGIVHRLDKDTSGLMVVAKTALAHSALVDALARHEVGREYLALVWGTPTAGGTVDRPIGRHRSHRTRMAVRSDGREAVSHYRVVERFLAHSLLRVALETGRTHQIRVHLSHIGHPVVGDPVYGGRRRHIPAIDADLQAFRRQALHATQLQLSHPRTGRSMQWSVPPPADFQHLLTVMRSATPAGVA